MANKAKFDAALAREEQRLPDVSAQPYRLPRSADVHKDARKIRKNEMQLRVTRRKAAEKIVYACLEALDAQDDLQLFTSEQLMLLDQLYQQASALEALL